MKCERECDWSCCSAPPQQPAPHDCTLNSTTVINDIQQSSLGAHLVSGCTVAHPTHHPTRIQPANQLPTLIHPHWPTHLQLQGSLGPAVQALAAGYLAAWAAAGEANRTKLTGLGLPQVVAHVAVGATGGHRPGRAGLGLHWDLVRCVVCGWCVGVVCGWCVGGV